MDREVEDILQDSEDEDGDTRNTDFSLDIDLDEEETSGLERRPTSFKRKREKMDDHLYVGDVLGTSVLETNSISRKLGRQEDTAEAEGDEGDDEPDVDDLEPTDEDVDDSEWCLAGQALEREFLSGEED